MNEVTRPLEVIETEINFYKDAFDVYQEVIVEHCKKFIDCRLIFKED